MSFFSSTSKVTNTSPIPSSVSKSAAVTLLHDHEFFLLCDPHYGSHKVLDQPTETSSDPKSVPAAVKHFKIPSHVSPLPTTTKKPDGPVVSLYEVVDHMPNPVWSSNVVSTEEFVDHDNGMWVRIRSPMGVVMETTWSIKEKGGALELVEDIAISCSRLVMGIVKGQCESNWPGIHKKLIEKLIADAEGAA
ncbi:hypothetical protein GGR57DRAFT_457178 [Xylariaceae sp. FL1272]|nr:hypothetical protein GGR57DRAFT_457178 [Xylariaceae sp. FL1272]